MKQPECSCADAERNRRKRDPEPSTFPPNQDGEIVCRFCWNVLAVALAPR